MIAPYEEGILRYLNGYDPRIKEIAFSTTFGTAYQLTQRVQYPVCFIQRSLDEDSTVYPKSFDYEDDENVKKFFVATVRYQAYIYFGRESETIYNLQRFRFYAEAHPYIETISDDYHGEIGMRFVYIKMNSSKDGDNPQGAQRCIIALWESSIPFAEADLDFKLIERIKINVNGEITKIYE